MNWEEKALEFLAASLVRPFFLVAAAVLILRVFRVEHPASKHAVWTVVLAGMVIVPLASVLAPRVELAALPEGSLAHFENVGRTAHVTGPAVEAPASGPLAGHGAEARGSHGEQVRGSIAVQSADSTPAVRGSEPPAARPSPTTLLLWPYFVGLVFFAAYRVAGWVLLRRLVQRSTPSRGRLRESADVRVPVAAGVLRPSVILPADWRQWDGEKRRAVLRHELEHLRRRDPWGLALSRWVRCMLWFHPLAWLVSRKVSDLAEMACDAAAMGKLGNPARYSQILLEFAADVKRHGYRATLPGLAMARPSGLTRRIDAVFALCNGKSRRLARPIAVLVLAGVPILGAAGTVRLTEVAAKPLAQVKAAVAETLESIPAAQPFMRFGNVVATTLESFVEVTSQPVEVAMIAPPLVQASVPQSRLGAREFLDQYCVRCHSQAGRVGNLVLEGADLGAVTGDRQLWEKVARKFRHGIAHTPIPSPAPDATSVRAFTGWLENELDRDAPPFLRPSAAHRLNRTEYGNAVRDLLGLEINPGLLLPPEDSQYGFDNIVSAQSNSPERTQEYASAAESISGYAMTQGPSRSVIFVCRPSGSAEEDACATRIIANLAARAFRGMANTEDGLRLFEVYRADRQGASFRGSFDRGIRAVLRAILTDPKFLYRIEVVPSNVAAGRGYRISDLELASRLSFFLWSTGPDAALIDVAGRGELQNPAVLEREVRRMLKDPRAEALALNFAGQWLNLRGLGTVGPLSLFPDFDEPLRQAMRREGELFFHSIVQEDRSVVDLLTADYTFVNERLARHYGIPNVQGSEFRRISLGPQFDVRRGLLGKGAILTATSRSDRTSLTTRGTWILWALLGTPPPDPPPNVPGLPPNISTLPMREVMEQQLVIRADCRICHQITDPMGIALDNFDPIGKWRLDVGGRTIDPSTTLVDGTTINGPAELRDALLARPDPFTRTLTEKLFTYALGHGADYRDMPVIRGIVRDAARDNHRLSAIVLGIVKSEPFQLNVKE